MQDQALNTVADRLSESRSSRLAAAGISTMVAAMTRQPRRGALGGRKEENLSQPQDGAIGAKKDARTKVATIKPRNLIRLTQEPEDAMLTGGTRSLTRRLLGLNFGKLLPAKPSALVAGAVTRPKVA